MIKLQTVFLAAALATPFGLAIHDDLSTEVPSILDEEWAGDDGVEAAAPLGVPMVAEGLAELEREQAAEAMTVTADPQLAHDRALGEDALRRLLGAERASLGPALSALRFGMTSQQLAEAAPDVANWSLRSDELASASVALQYLAAAETQLSAVRIELSDRDGRLEGLVRAMWGEPQLAGEGRAPDIWINDAAGMRAALATTEDDSIVLELSRVMTLEQLLAEPGSKKLFGFETGPRLLGTRIDQLEGAYPALAIDRFYREYATLDVPGVAIDPAANALTSVVIGIRDDKVSELKLSFGCGLRCGEVMAAFERKLGKPASVDELNQIYVFGRSPKVTLRIDPRDANSVVEILAAP